jgi:hypothetical protein
MLKPAAQVASDDLTSIPLSSIAFISMKLLLVQQSSYRPKSLVRVANR